KYEEEKQKLIQAHSQTVLYIGELRGWFDDYFKAYTEERESQVKVPEAKKEQFDEMRKSILKHTRFSDCIQAFVPLQSEKYHSPCINGVFGVIGACGGMLLPSLASFRFLYSSSTNLKAICKISEVESFSSLDKCLVQLSRNLSPK
ncbi:unnamed protein product, partial [marine sediment metagenome]